MSRASADQSVMIRLLLIVTLVSGPVSPVLARPSVGRAGGAGLGDMRHRPGPRLGHRCHRLGHRLGHRCRRLGPRRRTSSVQTWAWVVGPIFPVPRFRMLAFAQGLCRLRPRHRCPGPGWEPCGLVQVRAMPWLVHRVHNSGAIAPTLGVR